MSEPLGVIALLPVDAAGLPDIPGAPVPKASIEHTLFACDLCERDCWIGPEQLKRRHTDRLPTACYFCLLRGMLFGYLSADELRVTVLDPKADETPRRT